MPLCGACHRLTQKYPVPGWVKVFFAVVAVLVLLGAAYNARFALAYYEVRRGFGALDQGDFAGASERFRSAAQRVPESGDLAALAGYFEGVELLAEGRSAEALTRLRGLDGKLPPNFQVEEVMKEAERGAAFDSKDYDRLLELSLAALQRSPGDAKALGAVASAYACKFAATGDEAFQRQSLDYLSQADARGGQDPAWQEYRQRIRHRLATREILVPAEFHRRYPDGWKE